MYNFIVTMMIKKRIVLVFLGVYLFSYAPFFVPMSLFFRSFFIKESNTSFTTLNQSFIFPDKFFYKNGEEFLSTTGENYMLHDNQWLRIPSKNEYEEILEEIPLVLRYFVKSRISTETYNKTIQMQAGGDTILNCLRNGNDFEMNKGKNNVLNLPFLSTNSNAMLYMQKRMVAHDKVVESYRFQEKIREKRRKDN